MLASEHFDRKNPGLLFTRYRFVWHVLFWIGIIIYDVLIWGMVDGKYGQKFVSTLAELPIKMAAAYLTIYVLIDKFLILKKYTQFLLLLFVSMLAAGTALRILSFYVLYPMYYPEGLTISLFFPPKILISIFYTYSWVAILSTLHLMRYYYSHQQATQLLQQKAERLEKEKLAAELKLLKAQINPHFLFNTLNNLYVLTLSDHVRAPEMVHKLSELMSYMLYDSNQREVPLEKEVGYIQNYIDLERLRYGNRLEVILNNYVKIDGITIAPLLLLPFVENSFKHGASNQVHSSWIHIDIEMTDGELILRVENNKPEVTDSNNRKSGLGLENLEKRLELLYPGRYTLRLFNEDDTYMAVLRIAIRRTVASKETDQEVLKTE